MKVIIEKSRATGEVLAPPSKSMAHRALICAALSQESEITNLAFSDDITATLECLKALGARVDIQGDRVKIGGLDIFNAESTELFCNESGSTIRFLLPLCLLSGNEMKLTGKGRLMERPMDIYCEICTDKVLTFTQKNGVITVKGRLEGGNYTLSGEVSSQFISGLLFALPLLENDSKLEITGNFESASYVDLTVKALKDFGANVKREKNLIFIKGGWKPLSREYRVEGDMSNAAFLDALNMLGGDVKVSGTEKDTLQGDRVYKEMFDGLKNGVKEFDLSDCPDLAPVMLAMAAVYGGGVFTGTKRLRIKESDRGLAMKTELKKFGIDAVINENSIEIKKGEIARPTEPLDGHNDHRIVMSLALLCSLTGGEIEGAEAVKKSFPDFFSKLSSLNVRLKIQ